MSLKPQPKRKPGSAVSSPRNNAIGNSNNNVSNNDESNNDDNNNNNNNRFLTSPRVLSTPPTPPPSATNSLTPQIVDQFLSSSLSHLPPMASGNGHHNHSYGNNNNRSFQSHKNGSHNHQHNNQNSNNNSNHHGISSPTFSSAADKQAAGSLFFSDQWKMVGPVPGSGVAPPTSLCPSVNSVANFLTLWTKMSIDTLPDHTSVSFVKGSLRLTPSERPRIGVVQALFSIIPPQQQIPSSSRLHVWTDLVLSVLGNEEFKPFASDIFGIRLSTVGLQQQQQQNIVTSPPTATNFSSSSSLSPLCCVEFFVNFSSAPSHPVSASCDALAALVNTFLEEYIANTNNFKLSAKPIGTSGATSFGLHDWASLEQIPSPSLPKFDHQNQNQNNNNNQGATFPVVADDSDHYFQQQQQNRFNNNTNERNNNNSSPNSNNNNNVANNQTQQQQQPRKQTSLGAAFALTSPTSLSGSAIASPSNHSTAANSSKPSPNVNGHQLNANQTSVSNHQQLPSLRSNNSGTKQPSSNNNSNNIIINSDPGSDGGSSSSADRGGSTPEFSNNNTTANKNNNNNNNANNLESGISSGGNEACKERRVNSLIDLESPTSPSSPINNSSSGNIIITSASSGKGSSPKNVASVPAATKPKKSGGAASVGGDSSSTLHTSTNSPPDDPSEVLRVSSDAISDGANLDRAIAAMLNLKFEYDGEIQRLLTSNNRAEQVAAQIVARRNQEVPLILVKSTLSRSACPTRLQPATLDELPAKIATEVSLRKLDGISPEHVEFLQRKIITQNAATKKYVSSETDRQVALLMESPHALPGFAELQTKGKRDAARRRHALGLVKQFFDAMDVTAFSSTFLLAADLLSGATLASFDQKFVDDAKSVTSSKCRTYLNFSKNAVEASGVLTRTAVLVRECVAILKSLEPSDLVVPGFVNHQSNISGAAVATAAVATGGDDDEREKTNQSENDENNDEKNDVTNQGQDAEIEENIASEPETKAQTGDADKHSSAKNSINDDGGNNNEGWEEDFLSVSPATNSQATSPANSGIRGGASTAGKGRSSSSRKLAATAAAVAPMKVKLSGALTSASNELPPLSNHNTNSKNNTNNNNNSNQQQNEISNNIEGQQEDDDAVNVDESFETSNMSNNKKENNSASSGNNNNKNNNNNKTNKNNSKNRNNNGNNNSKTAQNNSSSKKEEPVSAPTSTAAASLSSSSKNSKEQANSTKGNNNNNKSQSDKNNNSNNNTNDNGATSSSSPLASTAKTEFLGRSVFEWVLILIIVAAAVGAVILFVTSEEEFVGNDRDNNIIIGLQENDHDNILMSTNKKQQQHQEQFQTFGNVEIGLMDSSFQKRGSSSQQSMNSKTDKKQNANKNRK